MKVRTTRLIAVLSVVASLLGSGCRSTKPSGRPALCLPDRGRGFAAVPEELTATYVSEAGQRMTVQFDNKAHTVTVKLPGREAVTLSSSVAGSGARYTNGRKTFWEHHGEGALWCGEQLVFRGRAENPEKAR